MRTYEIVRSAPYCCVCAVLESILKKHGYDITQFDIANYIGLVCSTIDKTIIPHEIHNIQFSDNAEDWGVHLKNDTINGLFQHYNIPLKETFFSAKQFDEISLDSFFDAVSDNYDIMMFISHGALYNNKDNLDIGHCLLYTGRQGDNIQYIDPGPANLGMNFRGLYDIYFSIKRRSLLGGGLSIISNLDLREM